VAAAIFAPADSTNERNQQAGAGRLAVANRFDTLETWLSDASTPSTLPTAGAGPVQPTACRGRVWPLEFSDVRLLASGWWGDLQSRTRAVSLPYCMTALEAAGNLDNVRAVIGRSDAPYRGFPFNDTDIYKTLEAVAWSSSEQTDPTLDNWTDSVADLLSRAQAGDGYLNSYLQRHPNLVRYNDLAESHELYTAGHLIQAAIADYRATGKTRLLDVAVALADHLVEEFGKGRRSDYDGHPEIETALVELFRTSEDRAYLDLASQFVESRGQRIFGADPRGHAYFQDEFPVRKTTSLAGHTVRALYLEAGVVDVAVETDDSDLLDASLRRWDDMVTSKLYLTGGVGSRHKGEAFGDPYELPPDRAYCETCAAIASIQWNWRLLLATGQARFADLLERTLYNCLAASMGADGTSFFYSNPLQVRADHRAADEEESGRRLPWYSCACCPPNLMRLIASLQHYLATTDQTGVQIHQYTDAELTVRAAAQTIQLSLRTTYPWTGSIEVDVLDCTDDPWTLSLRVPHWASDRRVSVNDVDVDTEPTDGYLRIGRRWRRGDQVRLHLGMPIRLTAADRAVDATRGCVAIERGPLVYCVEAADNPGVDLSAITIDIADPLELRPITGWPDVQAVGFHATLPLDATASRPLYSPYLAEPAHRYRAILTAIPYYLWANRSPGAMRVWLPTS
jgi:uncharacterized protein